MPGYTVKTYICNGREYYEYDAASTDRDNRTESGPEKTSARVKKEFLFPKSLLSLLYLDIRAYEPLFNSIAASLQELRRTKDVRFADQAVSQLKQLTDVHIYFELLSLEWRQRLWSVLRHDFAGIQKLIPANEFAAIPTELSLIQRQIMELFRTVLDIDGTDLPVAEKMARYYGQAGKDGSDGPFCFETLSTRFELAGPDIFTEVLRPQTVRDLVGFPLKECVRREMKVRICKNCGRYFIIRGRTTAQYCDRAINGNRSCREIGAPRVWEKRKRGEPLFVMYRREYKNASLGSKPENSRGRLSMPGVRRPGRKRRSARRVSSQRSNSRCGWNSLRTAFGHMIASCFGLFRPEIRRTAPERSSL